MASRPPPSESQGLGAAPDLGATVLAKRVDRPPGQRVVGGEQPPHRLDLVVARVGQQGEGAGQTLDDTRVVEEQRRHPTARAQEELVIAGELPHLRRRYAQPDRGRFAAQPVVDELVDHRGVLTHDESLARRLPWRPPYPASGSLTRGVCKPRTRSPLHCETDPHARGDRLAAPAGRRVTTGVPVSVTSSDPMIGRLLDGRYRIE